MKNETTRRQFSAGLAALGASTMLPGAAMAQQKIVMRYGNAGAPTTLSNVFNGKLSDTLSKKTNGRLTRWTG